jgi:hypothetical protein
MSELEKFYTEHFNKDSRLNCFESLTKEQKDKLHKSVSFAAYRLSVSFGQLSSSCMKNIPKIRKLIATLLPPF